MKIKNPIIKGFNPDPSIIRVEDNYYIATSTFEWFPGVQLFHSKNLQDWKLINRPLNRISQLDMKGCDSSGGVFAPCLSYDKGIYYLMYTNVRTHNEQFMDCHNYLITTNEITGEWSEPIYIHSAGFDPSLFHDEDGKKWVVSVMRRYRADQNSPCMGGIVLQEYDDQKKCLVGEMHHIFMGVGITTPEGPHLYKKNGYYYLITAEGGTGFGHAVTMARSKEITGPYECHPQGAVLTSRNNLTLELQKAGHADLVETPNGEWYMVYLCGRPLPPDRNCVLGRETAIQKVEWRADDWLYLVTGDNEPEVECEAPEGVQLGSVKGHSKRYEFNKERLDIDFQSLRIPLSEEMMSLSARKGYLRLIGKDSPNSRFEQSLIARRQQSHHFIAETCVEFEPISEKQMAGLIYMYDINHFYYLRMTTNYEKEKVIDVLAMDRGVSSYMPAEGIRVARDQKIYMKLIVEGVRGQFYYALDGEEWNPIGDPIDSSKLSDDYITTGAYTGAMIGLGCHDMLYRSAYADFSYLEYTEIEKR